MVSMVFNTQKNRGVAFVFFVERNGFNIDFSVITQRGRTRTSLFFFFSRKNVSMCTGKNHIRN